MAALAVGAAGCMGVQTRTGWLDRPWIDSGCDAAGWCRLRGRLEMPRIDGSTRGRLRLDDGSCLPVDLTGRFVRSAGHWDGRRVAVRGRAVPLAAVGAAEVEGCPSDRLLYVDRLSLKVVR
ncbi:MAG: hypothetical protein H2038_01535 [Brevundimonas sp.]|uniref:hypothetical protein n=1 Tax=Brevundimonas sp. TaxID=1871086 RepID=UPI0017A81C18|nr:hypothetical protein [Brevundimonas sp.]MBA4803313.1 hypothetical protein [Brevundimonas sp.]